MLISSEVIEQVAAAAVYVPVWVRALFWLAMVLAALANGVCWRIVFETNVHKDQRQRKKYLGWGFGKMERIFNEYEDRFPAGRKTLWFKLLFIGAGWALGGWVLLMFLYSVYWA